MDSRQPPPLPPQTGTRGGAVARRGPARRWLPLAAVTVLILSASAVMYAFDPAAAGPASGRLPFPPCPFHKLTGFYCAGCGVTRALHHLLHGRLWRAMEFNPLAVLVLPWLAWQYVKCGARTIRLRTPSVAKPAHPAWIWVT